MKTFIYHQIQRLADQSNLAFAARNNVALRSLLIQGEGLEWNKEDAFGWSLVKTLTEARYHFLHGDFDVSHLETLENHTHLMEQFPVEWQIQTCEDLCTFHLHYGNFKNALVYLTKIEALHVNHGLLTKALETELKKLHLMYVFESESEMTADQILAAFETLHQTAKKIGCKSVELSTALFISKEYSRRLDFQTALKWADLVIDGFLDYNGSNFQLEIAFLHRSDIYRSLGLSAASQMDLESSKWVV